MNETEYTKNIQALDSMSDTELLITMLNAVTHGRLTETEAHDLAREIVEDKTFFSRIDTVSVPEFMELGLEEQEAVALVSMAEVLKRSLVKKSERESVFSSQHLGRKLIAQIGHKEQEHLMAIYLNNQNQIIDERVISIGTKNRSIASPSDILRYAVRCNATSIVVAHNHPSGSVEPSGNDRDFTRALMDCCKMFEIVLLDHVVVGRDNYYSFREKDYLFD
jgi:DNA repair protein RadC